MNADFSKFLCRKISRWREFSFEMFVYADFAVRFELATNPAFHNCFEGSDPSKQFARDKIFGSIPINYICLRKLYLWHPNGWDSSARPLNYAKCVFRIAPLSTVYAVNGYEVHCTCVLVHYLRDAADRVFLSLLDSTEFPDFVPAKPLRMPLKMRISWHTCTKFWK